MALLASLRSTIAYQTTGSTISTGAIYTTLAGNVPAWTNQLTYSTLTGSTISTNSIATASTLTGSSIILSGNMGIGTASPSQILDLYKNAGVGTIAQMNITSWAGVATTTNQSILNLRIQGAGGGPVDNIIIGQYYSSGSGTYGISFNPNGVNVMNVLSSGNVGIGTVNPGYTLDVVGSSSISSPSYVAFRNTGIGLQTTGGDLVNTQISLGGGFGPYIRAVQPNNTYTDQLRLDLCTNLTNNNTTPVPRISILSGLQSGYVGIGTTNPSATLHVNGTIKTSLNAFATRNTGALLSINSSGLISNSPLEFSYTFTGGGSGGALSPSITTYITSGVYIIQMSGAGSFGRYVAIVSLLEGHIFTIITTLLNVPIDSYSTMFTINGTSLQWNYTTLPQSSWFVAVRITPLYSV